MNQEKDLNRLRGFHFILGMMENQQHDSLCATCLSFAKSAETALSSFAEFEAAAGYITTDIHDELSSLLTDLSEKAARIRQPLNPVGQKETGNCKLPEGLCFSKAAMEIYAKAAKQ